MFKNTESMKFLEKDLEQIIWESDKEKLSDKGLYLYGKLKRQLRVGMYGIPDLLEFKRPYYHTGYKKFMKGEINIIELKKDNISVSSFFQALNYLKGVKTYIETKRPNLQYSFNYRITLIGKNIDLNSSVCYLSDFFSDDIGEYFEHESLSTFISMFTYDYDVDGLSFKEVLGYNITPKGF